MAPHFERQDPGSGPVIQGYGAGGFRVSGVTFEGGVLVTPTRALPWPATSVDTLAVGDFDLLEEEAVEVLLLGTGSTLRRPARSLLDALQARGVAVELMDSKAAARTYSLLAGEGRLVAAALLPL